jgi:riboflavin synthase
MFTGLIEATGRVATISPVPGGQRLAIATSLAGGLGGLGSLAEGDSIAVNGVCLTVASHDGLTFEADVSPATLAVTSLGALVPGRRVNLERPVRADARMGGHFVLGHVDGCGTVSALEADGDFHWLRVQVPADLEPYMISKGSVAIDGISLTVATLEPGSVSVQIVPYTLAHTTLGDVRAGDPVNIEADVLGKYVARLLAVEGRSADRVSIAEVGRR